MREESLLCHLKKRFVIAPTNSHHRFPVYPNVLSGMVLTTPDQAWVADLTYIRLRQAFVYLACIRRCLLAALCRLASLARDDDFAHPGRLASGHLRAFALAGAHPS